MTSLNKNKLQSLENKVVKFQLFFSLLFLHPLLSLSLSFSLFYFSTHCCLSLSLSLSFISPPIAVSLSLSLFYFSTHCSFSLSLSFISPPIAVSLSLSLSLLFLHPLLSLSLSLFYFSTHCCLSLTLFLFSPALFSPSLVRKVWTQWGVCDVFIYWTLFFPVCVCGGGACFWSSCNSSHISFELLVCLLLLTVEMELKCCRTWTVQSLSKHQKVQTNAYLF